MSSREDTKMRHMDIDQLYDDYKGMHGSVSVEMYELTDNNDVMCMFSHDCFESCCDDGIPMLGDVFVGDVVIRDIPVDQIRAATGLSKRLKGLYQRQPTSSNCSIAVECNHFMIGSIAFSDCNGVQRANASNGWFIHAMTDMINDRVHPRDIWQHAMIHCPGVTLIK